MRRLLSLTDVTIGHGSHNVVHDLCLEVAPGEVFGLLGPNGCGKSTTLSAIVGMLPFHGDIRIAGQTLAEDPETFKRAVGIVPQNLALYEELTVSQNLDFFARLYGLRRNERRQRLAEVLDFVQLTDRSASIVRTLSGGMQRRLNLACALLHKPQVLLLDEPTVGLDIPARDAIFANLRRLADEGRALVFTTHHLQEAADLCDRLGIMDEGRLVAVGSVAELCDSQRWGLDGLHDSITRPIATGAHLERLFLDLTGAERKRDTA